MPPPIPRPLFGAMALRPAPVAILRPAVASAASTSQATSPRRNFTIPPESPSYKPPPMPPQSEEPEKRKRERGHLPVPRKVFHNAETMEEKLHPDYVQRVYPGRRSDRRSQPPPDAASAADEGAAEKASSHGERVARWKARHTELRRENMRYGIQALANRQLRRDREADDRRVRRARRMQAFIEVNKPTESDRLTQSTIPAALLDTKVYDDPLRFEKAAAGLKRTQEMYEMHRIARRDYITELYVNAKNFIVDEETLEETVKELFSADYWKNKSTVDVNEDRNIWGTGMPPPLGSANWSDRFKVTGQLSPDAPRTRAVAQERMEKVAEKLTGGKMVQ